MLIAIIDIIVANDNGELASELNDLEIAMFELENVHRHDPISHPKNQFDSNDCVLSITCGSGGSDAQDWVAMLRRMYCRYAASKNFVIKVVEEISAIDVGLKFVELHLQRRNSGDTHMDKRLGAYGWMKGETGVHRLVRVSPFNAQGKRQTSFAAVQVVPLLINSEADHIQLPDTVRQTHFYKP